MKINNIGLFKLKFAEVHETWCINFTVYCNSTLLVSIFPPDTISELVKKLLPVVVFKLHS